MGLFDFWKRPDINEGVRAFAAETNAVLLDVRTRQEYAGGHIPGSVNLPLQEIDKAPQKLSLKDMPVYVYCLSGGRSQQAALRLNQLGYQNVHNIGGISAYNGKQEV